MFEAVGQIADMTINQADILLLLFGNYCCHRRGAGLVYK